MKTLKKLPILCLGLTILLTACAEDKAITDQTTRKRILEQEARKKRNQQQKKATSTSLRFEGAAVSINMAERVSEALKYVRVALELETDSRISIDSSNGQSILKVSKADLPFHNGYGDYTLVEDKELAFEIGDDSSANLLEIRSAQQLDLQNNTATATKKVMTEKVFDPVTQSRSVNFIIKDYSIVLAKDTVDADKYLMTLKVVGQFNASLKTKEKKEIKGAETFNYVITAKVDAESLKDDTVEVESLTGVYQAMKSDKGNDVKFQVSISAAELDYSFKGCSTIEGDLVSTYSNNNYPLTFSASQVKDANPKENVKKYGRCEKKATVDLTKILERIGYYVK